MMRIGALLVVSVACHRKSLSGADVRLQETSDSVAASRDKDARIRELEERVQQLSLLVPDAAKQQPQQHRQPESLVALESNHSNRSVAFVGIFGFGVDPQRGVSYQKDDASKIKPWRESCERLQMNCMVLNDIYSPEFEREKGSDHVAFKRMTPVLADGKTYEDKQLDQLTTSDMRFIQLLKFLKSPEGASVEYALLTDASDVAFLKNPLKLIEGMDGLMDTHYLFGQDEWRPRVKMASGESATERGAKYWKSCFGDEMPERFQADKFYNCAILGGHRSVLIPFLERMYYWYTKVKVENRFLMCDMFVFQRVILEEYNDRIITGYPWHAKFKNDDPETVAAIYHKTDMPITKSPNAGP